MGKPSKSSKVAAEALTMFKAEAEEVRTESGLSMNEVSLNMSGYASAYGNFLKRNGCTVTLLQQVADALDMRLVICLVEKGE